MNLIATIAGEDYEIKAGSLRVSEQFGARATIACTVIVDPDVRPQIDDSVTISVNGTPRWGGVLTQAPEQGVFGSVNPTTEMEIQATDWFALLERRLFSGAFAEEPMKDRLEYLIDNVLGPSYGITLDAGQVDGPDVPARAYELKSIAEIVVELQKDSNYFLAISPAKVAVMQAPSANPSPWNIADNDGHVSGDLKVTPTRKDFANFLYGKLGESRLVDKSETFTGTGSTARFKLRYPFTSALSGLVAVVVSGIASQQTLDWLTANADWYIDHSTNELVRAAGNFPSGDTVTLAYQSQAPFFITATTGTPPSLADRVDAQVDYPTIYDLDEGQALLDQELLNRNIETKEVTYETHDDGLAVGQSQDINRTDRPIDETCIIMGLETRDYAGGFAYDVRALTGGYARSSRDVWASAFNSGGGNRASLGGSSVAIMRTSAGVPTGLVWPQILRFRHVEYTYNPSDAPMSHLAGMRLTGGVPPDAPAATYVYFKPNGANRTLEGIYVEGAGDAPAGQVLILKNDDDVYSLTLKQYVGVTGTRYRQILTKYPIVLAPGGQCVLVLQARGLSYLGTDLTANGWMPVSVTGRGWYDIPSSDCTLTASAGTWALGTLNYLRAFFDGRRAEIRGSLGGTTVSATPQSLRLAIAGILFGAKDARGTIDLTEDGFVTQSEGKCYAREASDYIEFRKAAAANWLTTSGQTGIVFSVTSELE